MNSVMNTVILLMFGVAVPLVFFLFIRAILVSVFRPTVRPRPKGELGEANINFLALRSLDPSIYHLIADVTLPTPNGTTQIDHIIVSRYGVFVVETKTYAGWIFGNERDPQWTQRIFRRRVRFQNPLWQNYKHTRTLSELTGIPHEYFKSVVVFAGNSTFKTRMPPNVVCFSEFIRHLQSFRTPIIADHQVAEVVAAIREWAASVSDARKQAHVQNLRRNHAAATSAAPARLPPPLPGRR